MTMQEKYINYLITVFDESDDMVRNIRQPRLKRMKRDRLSDERLKKIYLRLKILHPVLFEQVISYKQFKRNESIRDILD